MIAAASAGLFFGHGHDVGPDGGHLGPVFVAHDGGHDVAAKGRAGLHEVALVVDGEAGAVGGEAGPDDGGDCAGQVAAKAGGPHEDDFGSVFFDQLAEAFIVAFGAVVPQDRGVDEVGLVCAVGEGFAAEVFYLVAKEDGD